MNGEEIVVWMEAVVAYLKVLFLHLVCHVSIKLTLMFERHVPPLSPHHQYKSNRDC
jgi:hypothetical protein